jgi:hypothetical protein
MSSISSNSSIDPTQVVSRICRIFLSLAGTKICEPLLPPAVSDECVMHEDALVALPATFTLVDTVIFSTLRDRAKLPLAILQKSMKKIINNDS